MRIDPFFIFATMLILAFLQKAYDAGIIVVNPFGLAMLVIVGTMFLYIAVEANSI